MKKFLIIATTSLIFASCNKPQVKPEYSTAKVYQTDILFTNPGEPKILNWFILPIENSEEILHLHNTKMIEDFSEYQFERSAFPVQVYKGRYLKDVQILKTQIKIKP